MFKLDEDDPAVFKFADDDSTGFKKQFLKKRQQMKINLRAARRGWQWPGAMSAGIYCMKAGH